jgi:hypothetical protein
MAAGLQRQTAAPRPPVCQLALAPPSLRVRLDSRRELEMFVIRMTTLGAVIALLTLVSAGVASAAPTNAPKGQVLDIVCDNGHSYTIAVNGNGDFSPGHIIDGGSGNLIPVSFELVLTDAAGNVVDSVTFSKPGEKNGVAGDLIACTFEVTIEDQGQTYTVHGTVVGFLTPRGR